MRVRFLLLIAALCAACDRPDTPPAAPRVPVTLVVRAGEFIQAEYVDSALLALADPRLEAEARARELWLRYGSPGMDSVSIRVTDGEKGTRFLLFVPGELGGPPPVGDPSRPVELEVRAGYVRAVYVDPALVEGRPPLDQNARMLALGRRVLGELGGKADSVQVAITDGALPERQRVWSTFPAAVLREP